MYSKLFIALIFIIIFTGCSSINDIPVENSSFSQTINARNKQVLALNHWTISGKIAFINNKQRQSATLYWQNNEIQQTEVLNLSTVLGIKVLELKRDKNNFTLDVDGKNYQTQALDDLIYHLTNLNLPTRAMSHWLKGLSYLPSDKITYNDETQLPETLTSQYNNKTWQVDYSKYHYIKSFQLAKQLTITQGELRIKIIIHSWKI
mgnify:CR=1 FL=1